MNEYPTLVIEISGHTGGSLVQQEVPAARLKYAGYGLTQPIADNATDEGRATNRLEKKGCPLWTTLFC